MRSLLALTPDELATAFGAEGIEPYRARQVTRWLYRRGERDVASMTDLGASLRARLARTWSTRALDLRAVEASSDGTEKLLLAPRAVEGSRGPVGIETVIIPEESRRTVCVSSQAGCSLDCPFCATGRMGLVRNLRSQEIVDQVLLAAERLRARGERPSHVVFMGMGEPLLNLGAVLSAIRTLVHPDGLGLPPRRITVSTAGVVPRIHELGRAVPVRLAVSLHATTDPVRDRLVPLNRRFPIAELLRACRAYPLPPRSRLSFEYTLIRDLNDGTADADRLVGLLTGLRSFVNLIPLNEHPGTRFRRPAEEAIDRFAGRLARARVPVAVRRGRGADILAACGQLGSEAPPLIAAARGR